MNAAHRVLDPASPGALPEGLCALAVMTKAPRPGAVKTRLTPPLSPEEAAALNTCFLQDTTAALLKTAELENARGIAVYTPVGAEEAYAGILPAEFELVPQRGGPFGERLVLAAEDLFRLGFASVCLIDSDSPTVPQEAFGQAVAFLRHEKPVVVLGPSDDGGYYLIGLNKPQPFLFEGIDWSTDRVLEQTLERASERNLTVRLLPTWYDVDDRETLQRLCRELFGSNGKVGEGYPAPATHRLLSQLLEGQGRDRIWPNDTQP
jgi:rSAM/selenodomain-associated transferase 1